MELLREVLAGDPPGEGGAEALSAELCRRLDGTDRELEARAWPALVEIVRGKLAINKPGHADYDFEGEVAS